MMDRYIEKLLIFLRSHDCNCHYTTDGKLMVEDVYTPGSEGSEPPILNYNWIEIEATPKAVREFLGY